jgi:hypothetical protein
MHTHTHMYIYPVCAAAQADPLEAVARAKDEEEAAAAERLTVSAAPFMRPPARAQTHARTPPTPTHTHKAYGAASRTRGSIVAHTACMAISSVLA